jgi:transcriptional activator SPT8
MDQDRAAGFPKQPQMAPQRDDDEKSDFDPLFDDEPDVDGDTIMAGHSQAQTQSSGPATAPLASAVQPQQPRQSTIFRNAPNAPPVLDPVTYNNFSPDILMTAAIDGQVMLWDRRVHSPGYGVGSLPLGEKTRPWCVSVSSSGIHRMESTQ